MKILMLNYEYPPIGGGGGVISKHIAEGLAELGHEIHVLTSKFQDTPEVSQPAQNLTVIRLKVNRKTDFKSDPIEMLDWVLKTKKYCNTYVKSQKFDLCFANFVLPGGEVALYLKKKFNLKFVVISHGHDIPWVHAKRLWPLYLMGYQKIKKVLNQAEKVFLQTPMMFENLKSFHAKAAQKVAIVPNGFSSEVLTKKENKEQFKVIFVGRIVKQKDPATLIKGFSNFLDNGGEGILKIFGDGPVRKHLQKALEAAGLQYQILLMGKTSQHEVLEELASSSVYVSTSLNEGMSMAMLEASATGLPIISTPVSGTSLILNQENSFLIDFKNADELSSALQKVYKIWKTESVFPTQNQIQFIRENFNWDKINLLYEKHLKALSA